MKNNPNNAICTWNLKTYHPVLLIGILLFALGGLLTACGSGQKTYTIGVINLAPPLDAALDGFKAGMAERGYIESENVTYIYEGATGSVDALDATAQRLVERDVDLILSITTPATQAAQRATAETDIPVVFVPVTDPVAAGLVQSLRRPGGNITGIMTGGTEGARLQWQLKIAPNVEKVYIPYNPDGSSTSSLAATEAAAEQLNVELVTQVATNPDEVAAAIEAIPEDADAIFILNDGFIETQIDKFIEAALERDIPISASSLLHVSAGVLFAYGHRHEVNGQAAAGLAAQILEGVEPADLPVETAETFLSINLKSAEAIGLDIPDSILRQADTVIR